MLSTAVAQEFEKVRQTIKEPSQGNLLVSSKSTLIAGSVVNMIPRTPRYSLISSRPVGEYKLKGFKTPELIHEVF